MLRQASRVLLEGATSGSGTIALAGGVWHTCYIRGSAGVSSGTVQIETASDPSYAGTWAPIGSAVTVTADTEQIVQATGAIRALRARITSAIVGGTVTVIYDSR